MNAPYDPRFQSQEQVGRRTAETAVIAGTVSIGLANRLA
jgi:hypothetical protein